MDRTVQRRRRRTVDTMDFLAMVGRMLNAAGDRVGDGDPDQFRQLLKLRELLDEALVEAVRGMRDSGTTWEEIGAAAGTTRQAALMRWNPKL